MNPSKCRPPGSYSWADLPFLFTNSQLTPVNVATQTVTVHCTYQNNEKSMEKSEMYNGKSVGITEKSWKKVEKMLKLVNGKCYKYI